MPHIIRAVISKRMKWAGHVALSGRREIYEGFWREKLKGRDWKT
jgi:hypothetical protein